KNHHRNVGPPRAIAGLERTRVRFQLATSFHDHVAIRQEDVCHRHTLSKQTPGVVAQVQNERASATLTKRIQRRTKLLGRAVTENVEVGVSYTALEHDGSCHRWNMNVVSREGHRELPIQTGALHNDLYGCFRLATQTANCLIRREARNMFAIYAEHAITCLHTCAIGGPTSTRRNHDQPA